MTHTTIDIVHKLNYFGCKLSSEVDDSFLTVHTDTDTFPEYNIHLHRVTQSNMNLLVGKKRKRKFNQFHVI